MKYIAISLIVAGIFGLLYIYVVSPAFRPVEDIQSAPFARVWPPGMLEYKSWIFKFSLLYPDDLRAKEYNEGRGTTIVFENAKKNKGFQIFVTPYLGDYITPERFKSDAPSGVIKDQTDILIDGAKATMFYSENNAMGETREVWFIKNSFLYEVTTYRDLDYWLSTIMQTWEFLEI